MAAALPVEGEGSVDVQAIAERMRLGIPPEDVQEYLWRVRIEAEGIPDVVVAADIDPRRFDAQQTPNMPAIPSFAAVANERVMPTQQWKDELLADFVELRQLIARWEAIGPPATEPGSSDEQRETIKRTNVPRMSDEDGWQAFFFGKPSGSSPGSSPSLTSMGGTPPHLRLLLQFDQVLTRRLIDYHTAWLEGVERLSRARAVWIYALLARLDKPVHAGVAATIRQLLRRCWQLRSDLDIPSETPERQLDKDEDDRKARELSLKSLNVLITIAGDFFGQLHDDTTAQP